jgi:hypothetical protein
VPTKYKVLACASLDISNYFHGLGDFPASISI